MNQGATHSGSRSATRYSRSSATSSRWWKTRNCSRETWEARAPVRASQAQSMWCAPAMSRARVPSGSRSMTRPISSVVPGALEACHTSQHSSSPSVTAASRSRTAGQSPAPIASRSRASSGSPKSVTRRAAGLRFHSPNGNTGRRRPPADCSSAAECRLMVVMYIPP
ncbi:hypothetical protein ACG5V6_09345 [Streptomyces chitinivorans]|uniref:Uncharacterized protein n=1 Tax=Streptomyces chitinivorans TaxID=1257027 RepID=A0ABW7HRG4_9ACTN|nr:hypothetical protein [Streptomyces chitinivorans]MDH2408554.1 hypothetical protein [Streptomyces chitinivorans]